MRKPSLRVRCPVRRIRCNSSRRLYGTGGSHRVAALLFLAFLDGCSIHEPDLDRKPLVAAGERFREHPRAATEVPFDGAPWWESFGDPELQALIEEALSSNLDVRRLARRIEQADALLWQAGGRLLPQLDAGGNYVSRWEDPGDDTESASVGLFLDWELDVWGRLRSAREAARLDSLAARHDWRGGLLILSAAVAETYVELVEQRAQLELIEEQLEANTTLLDLTRLRFGQGQSSIVAVLQQREQLASTRTLVPIVEARLRRLEYSLDVLLGRAPDEHDLPETGPLRSPPPLPEVGIPADLLGNRPDLLAALSRVKAIDYRVGEALADRFPRLTIGGSLEGTGNPGIDTLVGSVFAGAVGPLVDGGVRRAEVELQRARLAEVLADYSQRYLVAVQEVETALHSERKQAELVALLESELTVAQQLLTETRNRYSQGLTDYLPVLAALVTVQNLERELITSRRVHLSFRIALHRALGGPLGPRLTDPELTLN